VLDHCCTEFRRRPICFLHIVYNNHQIFLRIMTSMVTIKVGRCNLLVLYTETTYIMRFVKGFGGAIATQDYQRGLAVLLPLRITRILDLVHRSVFCRMQRFGNWTCFRF
jgi:hypothetical protein